MSEIDRQATVFVALGSNLGDRRENLRRAVLELRDVIAVERISSIWLTEPVGFREQPAFYNAALEGRSPLAPRPLLDALLEVERRMGRRRDATSVRMGPRIIDLDLLVYDGVAIGEPGLVLPHPRMASRRFVLAPLAEIAPHAVHPILNKDAAQLLSETGDFAVVKRWNPNAEQKFENDDLKIFLKTL